MTVTGRAKTFAQLYGAKFLKAVKKITADAVGRVSARRHRGRRLDRGPAALATSPES
ncbi:hypothetical protein ABZV67_38145 [Streptomyces sp. NPDC005065]|uniref:hypothetical protein n=1 Tax=Streptomyces sp. NPDC005065 TaxID=3154461 RepID=UPI0033BB4248